MSLPWPYLRLIFAGADAEDDAFPGLVARVRNQAGSDGLHPELEARISHGLGDGLEGSLVQGAVEGGGAVAVGKVRAHASDLDAFLVDQLHSLDLIGLGRPPCLPFGERLTSFSNSHFDDLECDEVELIPEAGHLMVEDAVASHYLDLLQLRVRVVACPVDGMLVPAYVLREVTIGRLLALFLWSLALVRVVVYGRESLFHEVVLAFFLFLFLSLSRRRGDSCAAFVGDVLHRLSISPP